ncbi:G1/S-specific cyclin-D2 isoform X1 [Drosophila nasuta]|uniref:G1/S-specific cyclin-D2 isoform X1 n=2 Tax=Drosophila nasuta TaxID=42062 RepID=UPI00295EA0B7|nr:G1/S-specific cyclin-D2 isoform X1 [Drosophila nasuta]
MDLLCSESLQTDSEQALNVVIQNQSKSTAVAERTSKQQHININGNSPHCSLGCDYRSSNVKKKTSAAADKSDLIKDSPVVACNMSKLVYVFTSVASSPSTGESTTTTATSNSPQQNTQSIGYQATNQQPPPPTHNSPNTKTINRSLTTINTNAADPDPDIHNKHANAHLVVNDPTFKTDRCLENALKTEEKHQQQITKTYFQTIQKDITPPMRKIVAEWMMEVCIEEKCQEEVVLLALGYMDRFLFSKSVRKTHLQILAAACLLLASKLREPHCYALSAELLVFYTDNSINKDDLIKWELFVLSRLGWDLSSVTPLDFLELLIIRLPVKNKNFSGLNIEQVRQHAQTFISLAAKEHKFATYTASTIAASSIAASICGLKWDLSTGHNIHFLLSLLTDLTSVGQDQLQQCMMQMEDIFKEHSHNLQPYFVTVENPPALKGYYNQYSHQQYHQYQKSMMPVLQTCKMQAQGAKELHEIEF